MKTVEDLLKELDDVKEILSELSENTQGQSIAAETYKVLSEIYRNKQIAILEQLHIHEALKKTKSAVYFTFGRFNPVTKGHQEMIDFMVEKAKAAKADAIVFTSMTQDAKKNPLPWEAKVRFLKKFMKGAQISDEKDIRTVFEALYRIRDMGYTKVKLFVGDDREAEMVNSIRKYIGDPDPEKGLPFEEFEVAQTPPRTEGVSGTQMRKFATSGDFKSFKANLPSTASEKDARFLYNLVRVGLKIDSDK